MSPRPRDPEAAVRLVEVAARLLSEEGADAVTARRLAREMRTSTMAVYTHFGSMDELMAEVWRTGFRRFGAALDHPRLTADACVGLDGPGLGVSPVRLGQSPPLPGDVRAAPARSPFPRSVR